MSTDHTIEITRDHEGLARLAKYRPITDEDRTDYYRAAITCSDPESCPGWIECREPHEVEGRSAEGGPWTAEEGDPWAEQDEYEFHGVAHEWRSGYGWTVAYPGCPVAAGDWEVPDEIDTTVDGKYPVDADWDDDTCYLTVLTKEKSA